MNPQFPIYIPSKGRHESRVTVRHLQRMGVPFRVIVEEQEYEAYASVIPAENLIILDPEYQRKYETCDDLGDSRSKGPGPARNFAWEHSISEGHKWHWVMDDNLQGFWRFNRNRQIRMGTGSGLKAMEDFCLQYENVAMAGPNYFMFVPRKVDHPPIIMNTRIYSCNLIRNDVPHRWRGRYNEDTILSLDVLKDGWCTVQFNAFLQWKMPTQALPGGNTGEFYHSEGEKKAGQKYADGGTTAKSEMLQRVHPDVARMTWKFSRIHHVVDYRPFRNNRLVRCESAPERDGPNEYGMTVKELSPEQVEARRNQLSHRRR